LSVVPADFIHRLAAEGIARNAVPKVNGIGEVFAFFFLVVDEFLKQVELGILKFRLGRNRWRVAERLFGHDGGGPRNLILKQLPCPDKAAFAAFSRHPFIPLPIVALAPCPRSGPFAPLLFIC
jgi:hypothetical protein